ncbi:hypothetical protein PTKIN_Ptkin01aG0019300 [Pterospermum kingtungense]
MAAVMLIKDFGQAIKSTNKKKLIPTFHLVNQQFECIKIHISLQVEQDYGAKGVDEWNSDCWGKEIKEHDAVIHTVKLPKQSTTGDVLDDLKTEVDGITITSKHRMAEPEVGSGKGGSEEMSLKDKGNEFFKAGNYLKEDLSFNNLSGPTPKILAIGYSVSAPESVISSANKVKEEEDADSDMMNIEWPGDSLEKAKLIRAKAQSMTGYVEAVSISFIIAEAYLAAIESAAANSQEALAQAKTVLPFLDVRKVFSPVIDISAPPSSPDCKVFIRDTTLYEIAKVHLCCPGGALMQVDSVIELGMQFLLTEHGIAWTNWDSLAHLMLFIVDSFMLTYQTLIFFLLDWSHSVKREEQIFLCVHDSHECYEVELFSPPSFEVRKIKYMNKYLDIVVSDRPEG